jgi:RecA/RadA recombinase
VAQRDVKLVLLDSIAALLLPCLCSGVGSHWVSSVLFCLLTQVAQRDVKLVLLDSIAALLRTELGGGDASALAARGEQLGRQATALKVLAEAHRIPVVVTNQVRM